MYGGHRDIGATLYLYQGQLSRHVEGDITSMLTVGTIRSPGIRPRGSRDLIPAIMLFSGVMRHEKARKKLLIIH